MIIHVDKPAIPITFRLAADLITKATDESSETPDSLMQLLQSDKADMWVAGVGDEIVGVCFTQILIRPKDKILHILALGGFKGSRWLRELRSVLTKAGKKAGATKAVMMRNSGKKLFYGLKPVGYCYEDVF